MVYHGENAVRADQRSLTWMGRPDQDTRALQNPTVRGFHDQYSFNGPTKADLGNLVNKAQVFDAAKQAEVDRKNLLMRYTSSGEGCRLLGRDEQGRSYSIRPGRDFRQPGTANNAIEAAEANKFYPHQEHKILEAAMTCGPTFACNKTNFGVKSQPLIDILRTPEVLEQVLVHMSYTDRASLSQTCPEAAVGISKCQTVWLVNHEDFGDAEFQDEEFKHIVEAGEMWNVTAPRGAKILMVTMAAGEYQASNGSRPYSSYMKIAGGMLRFLRSIDNTGHCVEQMTLKNVPFLDHRVLAGIVEACPKLQKLEIPGCEQFTLFSVEPFLNFLEDIQKKRGTNIYFDVAPTFYKGVRWMDFKSEKLGESTYERKGTFGVAESDPGCDIPMALCKVLLHHILPAMKAAGHLHMIYDYSSLFRQWCEALPAPRSCIAMILAAWELDERIRDYLAEAEGGVAFCSYQRNASDPPELEDELTRSQQSDVLWLRTVRHWMIVRATCGENGWKQTADRGFYSCNYQCTAANFLEHSEMMVCDTCKLGALPRIFFNACETCEGCRLQDRVLHGENGHLQYLKSLATAELGYGTNGEPFRTNAESNFPFDAFKRDEHGNLQVKTRADFVRIMCSAPSLHGFINAATELHLMEQRVRYRKGRRTIRQLDNPYAGIPSLQDHGEQLLNFYRYRRALTHEEYAVSNGKGWEPANKNVFMQW